MCIDLAVSVSPFAQESSPTLLIYNYVSSLAISLLQIDSILNDVWGRTFVISAFVTSGGGLVLAEIFVSHIPEFSGRKGRKFWIDVSTI